MRLGNDEQVAIPGFGKHLLAHVLFAPCHLLLKFGLLLWRRPGFTCPEENWMMAALLQPRAR